MWLRFKVQALQHIKKYWTIYLVILFSFTVGITTGAFTVGSMSLNQKNELIQYMNGFFSVINKNTVDTGSVFRQSLLNNFQTVALAGMLGLTIIGIPFIFLIIGIRGFFIGFTVGFLVGELGIKGFILVILAIIPQNIFIIPCVILIGVLAIDNALKRFKDRKIPRSRDERIHILIPYISAMSVLFIILMVGTVIESIFVPFILRISSALLL